MLKYFYIFIIYSILGWVMEVIIVSTKQRKLTPRGFLIGPWCPIYGFGALSITLLLKKYYNDPIVLFVMSFLLGTILEYLTSYFMEKIFKARWWDYSTHKFHINGRVSLTTSLGFGLLGVILIYLFNPFFLKVVTHIPTPIFNIINIIILIIFICDFILSFKIIYNLKYNSQKHYKDITVETTEEVKKILRNKSIFNKRLFNAFPHLTFKNIHK